MEKVELTGKVVLQKYAKGSKSDHDAVYLDTGAKMYRLKKKGGNPFYDESLHKLVGKIIKAEGTMKSYFFEITRISEELM